MSSSSEEPACIIEGGLSLRWARTDEDKSTPVYEQEIEEGELLDKTSASAVDYSSQDEDTGNYNFHTSNAYL